MIDPIKYGLIFERFIDVNRDDPPDVDSDFNDEKRDLVFQYMANKFGQEHVARLGVTTLYKPKSFLNEAGAALDIPPWKINPVADSLLDRSAGDDGFPHLDDTRVAWIHHERVGVRRPGCHQFRAALLSSGAHWFVVDDHGRSVGKQLRCAQH